MSGSKLIEAKFCIENLEYILLGVATISVSHRLPVYVGRH
jgi:hypothetical protein